MVNASLRRLLLLLATVALAGAVAFVGRAAMTTAVPLIHDYDHPAAFAKCAPHAQAVSSLRFGSTSPNGRAGSSIPSSKTKVLTADCPYGTVTIEFDHEGQLKSIDVS